MIETKNKLGEGLVFFAGHFTVVSELVIEFGASWGGSTVVNGGSNSHNRECTGAENAFIMYVVVFIFDDSTCGGACG